MASGLTYVANVATTGLDDDNKGKVTLDATADFTANQKVLVTVLDAATGTNAKAELTVVEAGALKELTFGTVTLPTGKTRVETGLANAAQVAVTAKDSYGNDLTTVAELNAGATIVSSVTGATASFVDVDNKPVLQLDTQALTTAKSVTITVLIKSTGTPVSYTLATHSML